MPIVISIEGNIGSGKTTLFVALQERFKSYRNIVFLTEPVAEWNSVVDQAGVTILEKYYANQTKYAFSFQMMAFTSRLAALRAALKNPAFDVIITERCLCTDSEVFAKMLYDEKKLEQVEYSIYKKCFAEFIGEQPPIYFVYLKTDPMVAFNRVQKRARKGEQIPLSYLANCHLYHENWLKDLQADHLLVVDADQDIQAEPDLLHEWTSQIEKYMFYCEDRK